MTVANNYAPVVVAANGSTTVFSGSWNPLSPSYIEVQLLNTTTGVYTPVSQGPGSSQYQVTSYSVGGFTIAFNTAPASGNNVVITRDTTQQQTVPYTTSRGFQGPVEEGSFDALTAMAQELQAQISSCIQSPQGDTTESLVLPIATLRASQYLAFDSNGNVVTIAGQASAPVSTAMAPVVEAATLALARTLMSAAGLTDNNTFSGTNNFTNTLSLNSHPVWTQKLVTAISSSTTFTSNANTQYMDIETWGGAGGGGGAAGAVNQTNEGGGGGAGGYSKKTVTAATFGASQTVTIGAAGSGASAGNNSGTSGGQTSVGTLCVANGGSGGGGAGSGGGGLGGAGGASGTGDIAAPGMAGLPGYGSGNGTGFGVFGYGGNGASSSVGAGGVATSGASGSAVNGAAATGYGSGGGGGAVQNSAGTASGGAGTKGFALITEYISA